MTKDVLWRRVEVGHFWRVVGGTEQQHYTKDYRHMGVFQVSSNAKIATCQPFLALKSLIAEDVILRTLRDGAHLCIAIQVDVRHSHRL